MKPVPPPCIGVCDATPTTPCTGCHRKQIHIHGWAAAPDHLKYHFIASLYNAGKLNNDQIRRYSWLTQETSS